MFSEIKFLKYQEQKKGKKRKKREAFLYFLTNVISEYIQNTARLFFYPQDTNRKKMTLNISDDAVVQA